VVMGRLSGRREGTSYIGVGLARVVVVTPTVRTDSRR